MELSPIERLEKLEKRLKRIRSYQGLRGRVSEVLKAKPADLRGFKEKIGNHLWKGVVYQKRNSLMGSIFSFFDKQLFIVRGYPKIRYAEKSKVLGKEVVAQKKYDGTNLLIFLLPDGTLWGKTRMTHTWHQVAYKRKDLSWRDLFFKVSFNHRVKRLCEEKNVIVCGELYGNLIPSDFIRYSIPINFKGFDIISQETKRFLDSKTSHRLFFHYGIQRVENYWSGILTKKEIERLELELATRKDNIEGLVAKSFNTEERDLYFGKIKTQAIKEKCWENTRPLLPKTIISKAYKKVKENFPTIFDIRTIYELVKEELLEEYQEEYILRSKERIYKIIAEKEHLNPLLLERAKEILSTLPDKEREDKRIALKTLASKLKGVSPKTLYHLYLTCLNAYKREE